MLTRRAGRPQLGRRTTALAVAGTLALTSCGGSTGVHGTVSSEYCAVLADSVGLYIDNPVTQMGFPIGKVTRIEPHPSYVAVRFTVEGGRPLPDKVRGVVRSPSILADRSLELVGNYEGGARLQPGDCIPRDRTATPLSISEIIGSASDFVNQISPDGSPALQNALSGIDRAVSGTGQPANELLTRSSALLDNPDQTITELGEATRNVAQLTQMLRDNRGDLRTMVRDLPLVGGDINKAIVGGAGVSKPLPELITLVDDLELELGPELQLALDTTSDTLRILSPHYKGIGNILNFVPRAISGLNGEPPGATAGGLAKHLNNHVFNLLPYRPPLFRIPTPNGLLACGIMNSAMPGSCADVGGSPYAVDVALLQYVLSAAAAQP